ncbi:glycoside hydrolase family 2 protein [Oceanobacillus damuensis]|uniref:glycoside hydrolase family 2 protein n=1 Tax=Oceanobacillus damuensis TaxID=937928 RepID=UPI0008322EFE|nr:glycoside hydrolase family 2 [Oceanobacillus damuensis]
MANLRNEYPRPQLGREQWLNLNGEWNFAFDDNKTGLKEKWYDSFPAETKINVPFVYQSKGSGIHDTSFHDVVWYHRSLSIPEEWEGKSVILHFGAVDYRAWVYVNGQLVTFHEGGHTPFHADITHVLSEKENSLVVRVEDPSEDETIPRGKQYWKEESDYIFYTRTTGIWQTVWLEPVSENRIDSLRWTPQLDRGDIDLEMELTNQAEQELSVQVSISFKGKEVISDTVSVHESYIKRSYNIRNRFTSRSNVHGEGWYWTPETPNLFDVELKLLSGSQEVLDHITSYFGMRKISIENGQILLNNFPYYQKLILDQGYFPEGLLTAPSDDAHKQDIVLAKEMGFNGARKHQKVEDPRYLYWADKLGFLVWGEMANASEYSEEAARRMNDEWIQVVNRDYNHPSLVAWVPLNESWGIPLVGLDQQQQAHALSMYYLTKSLDTTRPVFSNEGWEHVISDICGIHNYRSAEELKKTYQSVETAINTRVSKRKIYANGYQYNNEPIMVTEYGGIAYDKENEEQEKGWGYTDVGTGEALIEEYKKQTEAIMNSEIIQGFCYTQLTDVEQEINGLLTYDRKPKCDLTLIKEINDQK